jgi:methionyl aminopeptidase
MGIIIKNSAEINKMRRAGRLTGLSLRLMESMIRPGVTTGEIDRAADAFIRSRGGVPTFMGYRGFPKSVCISVNDEVIHGIPGDRALREGDIVSVDVGAKLDGFNGDAARTFAVGHVSETAARLIRVTRECFFAGLKFARAGEHLHSICAAVQKRAETDGFNVVHEFIGHGVGRDLHEDPEIPNYKPRGRGPRLLPGMTFAVEPMVNTGSSEVEILENEWTVATVDGGWSAHYENTILVTNGEPELLTYYESWNESWADDGF